MVRALLGRGNGRYPRRREPNRAAYLGLQPVRRLRESITGVLPWARADGHRMGRDPLEDVPQTRSLPAGGLLGSHEDRAPAWWRVSLRRGRSRQDLRWPDADRTARPARGQARCALRPE